MRAKILGLCLLMMAFLTLKSQTITSVTPNNCVTGQVLNVTIMGTNTSFVSASYVYLNGPANIYATNTQIISTTQVNCTFNIPPNSPLGSYNLTFTSYLANYTMPNAMTIGTGTPPGNYGQLTGRLFADAYADCLYGTGETPWAHRTVVVNPGNFVTAADAAGIFYMYVPLGSYTITHVPYYPDTVSCPSGGTANVSLTYPGQVLINNFATSDIYYTDARVYVSHIPLRPGFNSNFQLFYSNPTNDTIPAGIVKYKKPAFTTLHSATPMPSSIIGDTLIWSFTNLIGMENISFTLTTNLSTPIGTPYDIEAWIVPSPMDNEPQNNSYLTSRTVVGSYDPNDKHALTASGHSADADIDHTEPSLQYIVRFQNTGTDTAFNIYIRDTLDLPHLEASGFRMLGASHPYQLSMGTDGQMEILFPNILLPDSGRNQAGSNGYFAYEIGIRPGLAPGTVIDNSASIYFDFNAPVMTNTVHTRLCDQLQSSINHSVSGLAAQFNAATTGTVNGLFWDFGDGATSTQANPTHTYAADGQYTVCLIAVGACRNDTSCIQLSVCGAAPTAAFAPAATGLQVTFANTSSPAVAYHWDFGDGDTSALAAPTHTYPANGTYTACLTVTDLCGVTAVSCSTFTLLSVGLPDVMPGFGIAIRPNPMHEQAELWVWHEGTGGAYEVTLYTVTGTEVMRQAGTMNTGLRLERGALAAGLYQFRIRQDGQWIGSGRILMQDR